MDFDLSFDQELWVAADDMLATWIQQNKRM